MSSINTGDNVTDLDSIVSNSIAVTTAAHKRGHNMVADWAS